MEEGEGGVPEGLAAISLVIYVHDGNIRRLEKWNGSVARHAFSIFYNFFFCFSLDVMS